MARKHLFKVFFVVLMGLHLQAFCDEHTVTTTDTYTQIVCTRYSLDAPSIPRGVRKSIAKSFTDARGTVWQATGRGLVSTRPGDSAKSLLTGKDGLPILSLTGITGGPDGSLWLATGEGAVLFTPGAAAAHRTFYFAGQRYLSDNQVLQIVVEESGKVWIRTRTGISLLAFTPYTLPQKSEAFLTRIADRHNRYGYVAPADLLRAGDPASFRRVPDDNDGLWTSIYVAAECFRYSTTGSQMALENARTSLRAMLRLLSITGIPGFPARSLMHRGDFRHPDGEWHWTPDGQWEWKGDTSSDELVGHFFAYWVAYHLLPGEEDRAAIRAAVSSIASGLLDHQLHLVGYGGRVTTWGRYDPAYLNGEGSDDRALDSLELLSHLRVAYEITGEAKFLKAYQELGSASGYVDNFMHFEVDKPEEINYSDEELAFLSFYPLMNSETDVTLRGQYQAALTKLWLQVRSEKNPLWNLIYAQGTQAADYDGDNTVDALNRIPLSTVSFAVRNSPRADLVIARGRDRFGEAQAENALPPNERRVMKWNGNPFQLDGGDKGSTEDDGAFFLLPYWLGRYYHLLSPQQPTPPVHPRIPTVVISHRGEHLHHPENTLPAYQAAIDAGADYFEVDVRTTSDGKLVLMHDDRVDRTTGGEGLVKEMTFAQIRSLDAGAKFSSQFAGTRVPSFDEALALAQGKIGIYVDTKDADPRALVAAIVGHAMQDHVVIYGDPALLQEVHKIRPDLKVMPEAESLDHCRMLVKDLQPPVLAFDAGDFKAEVVACAQAANARIYVDRLWADDNAGAWQDALDRGANGIQTDHPAELVRYLRAHHLASH